VNQAQSTLTGTTKLLHIIIALGMITLLTVGIIMSEFEIFFLYDIHKSFGAIIFVLALARVIWRVKKGWPSAVGVMSKAQHMIAKAIHWILIISTVLYPLSGLMMSIGGGHGLTVFGLEIVAEIVDSAGDAIPVNAFVGGLGHDIHGLITYFVIGAIVLHIVGALKHHFIDKDETITRMFSLK
jgi:cytochrome b561